MADGSAAAILDEAEDVLNAVGDQVRAEVDAEQAASRRRRWWSRFSARATADRAPIAVRVTLGNGRVAMVSLPPKCSRTRAGHGNEECVEAAPAGRPRRTRARRHAAATSTSIVWPDHATSSPTL